MEGHEYHKCQNPALYTFVTTCFFLESYFVQSCVDLSRLGLFVFLALQPFWL